MANEELKLPKDLENNQFIKKLFEEFIKVSKQVGELKDNKNSLEIKVAGLKTVLEKEFGVKTIESEHEVKLEYPGSFEDREQTKEVVQKVKRITGQHDFVFLDQEGHVWCSICDCKLKLNDKKAIPQKTTLWFCRVDCLLLYHSASQTAVNELKKSGKINH